MRLNGLANQCLLNNKTMYDFSKKKKLSITILLIVNDGKRLSAVIISYLMVH